MAELVGLPPKQRLLNLQAFVNEKIGQEVLLTEGIEILANQSGGSTNVLPNYPSVPNTYIDDYGEELTYNNWTSSDFIPVPAGYSYVVCNFKRKNNYFYNETKSPLRAVRFDQNQVQALTDEVKYIRVSDTTSAYRTAVLAFIK